MLPKEIEQSSEHLRSRNYSPQTVESYRIDLQVFFTGVATAPDEVTWRDIDSFVRQQHRQELAATTINRRLYAIKRFYDFLVVEQETILTNPIKPSHYLRQGQPLPKKLTPAQVRQFFAQITDSMDRALFLLMLRCGLRVSEAAHLRLTDIDWEQQALTVEQGKGRKDRRLYLSADALAGLTQCLPRRPAVVPGGYFFWNQKRKHKPLSVKAIQKKMERYVKAAQIKASCHSLRHTFASNLLEEGAAVVSIKEFLGHSSVTSSERYAKLSDHKIKQTYLQTIRKVINKTQV